jgi:uncharacterized protein (TIGR00255 family)
MIESMTGYGGGRARLAGNRVEISIRSVNNRSLKLAVRMPDILLGMQQALEEMIKGEVVRGTVFCHVEADGPLAGSYRINESAVLEYCRSLRTVAKKAGLPADIRVEQVAALPGTLREVRTAGRDLQKMMMKAAGEAVSALVKSRRKEGAKIEKELRKLLDRTTRLCAKVRSGQERQLKAHSRRLATRMREILSGTKVNVEPGDVVREAAILAERSDIAEELQRMNMHTQQAVKILSADRPAGRQLEFVSQEMLREANTMSAKSISSRLVPPLLELKSTIDRIREQAQNVQ